ncbi:MAG: cation transporter [Planctomycetota bacterium]|nr:cation transporter [Planctomycetota bacterium]
MTSPASIDAAARAARVRRVLLWILALNVGVALAKAVVGWLAGSLSMMADAAHSGFDSSSNVVGLVAVTFAAQAPDREHPYGHHRFEVLGAGAIGVFLALVVWGIVDGALERLRDPRAVEAGPLAFGVLLVTLVVNVFVAAYERRMGVALRSPVLIADSQHTASDVLATCAVLLALVCVRLGYPGADPVIALVIAAYVGWIALRVVLGAANVLADRAAIAAEEVERVASAVPGVIDCHDVRTRGPEGAVFADLRVHVDPGMTVQAAHDISHAVEAALRQAFPDLVDIVIHVEPAGVCHE